LGVRRNFKPSFQEKGVAHANGHSHCELLTKHKHQNQQQALCVSIRLKTTSVRKFTSSRPHFRKTYGFIKTFSKSLPFKTLSLLTPKTNRSLLISSNLSQKLHLNRSANAFLRKFPHIFDIYYEPSKLQPFCRLTDAALDGSRQEAEAINASLPFVVKRLVRILSMFVSTTFSLRVVFEVWRELGLADDFEDSVIGANSSVSKLCDVDEPNTHLLKLVGDVPNNGFRAVVEDWRAVECCKEMCSVNSMEMWYSFKQRYPPRIRLSKNFRANVVSL